MALSDRIKRIYERRFLRRGFFAERGQFARGHNPNTKRPITTSVKVVADKTETEQKRDRKTVITIFAMRDEGLDTGGVNEFCTGDLYWRDPEFDPNPEPFVWTGELREQGQHYSIAVFERYESISQGQGV